MKYYYDMILAAGYSFNRDYEKAIAFARRSLKANKHHQPTLRALLLAQGESNQIEDARQTLSQLLQETPNLTIALSRNGWRFKFRTPARCPSLAQPGRAGSLSFSMKGKYLCPY
ncbi:tetratricopeptide repeat protein [Polaromonas sp. P1(28)-8]|nr:tetratricopeptide repeat protein [Polaromonas sp. P1(28)-8]